MSGKKSRNKGARGERQVADLINAREGLYASRMGRNGITAEDVDHNLKAFHIEVKNQETWALPAWLKQAESDCPEGLTPLVVFKKNHQPWRVVLPFDSFLDIVERLHESASSDN